MINTTANDSSIAAAISPRQSAPVQIVQNKQAGTAFVTRVDVSINPDFEPGINESALQLESEFNVSP